MEFEDRYDTHTEWIFRGLHYVPERPSISIVELDVPVRFDTLDLSLLLCSLFLSNYDLHKKHSICWSEQNGCSAQLWASLVHYKSRL